MNRYFLILMFSVLVVQSADWGYGKKNGPAMWGKLNPKFEVCSTGMRQSPIDIKTNKVTETTNQLHLLYGTNAKDIMNNGHTVVVNFDEAGGLVYQNKQYNLVQLHFHTPSETHIDGKIYPMEMHLVHEDKNGNLLVLAVLFEKGQNNMMLNNILSYAPIDLNKAYPMDMIYISQILPKKNGYYAFSGSLTTPPCSEGVQWIVLKDSVEVSQSQVDAMYAILKDVARDIQPLNNRVVLSAP